MNRPDKTLAENESKSNEVVKSVPSLGWLNFFLADVQTGVGPFLAAYLAANHWNARDTGFVLTFGGMVGVILSPFAGAIVDASRNKRLLVAAATVALSGGAVLVALGAKPWLVGPAQVLIGSAGAFLGPTVAAMTLGIVGKAAFDRQFGKNQSFNSAGNVFTALLLAGVSWLFGLRTLFLVAAVLAVPVWLTLTRIDPKTIDNDVARGDGSEGKSTKSHWEKLCAICGDRTLVTFFGCAFLFHFANAAMLPQLGEMLAKGSARAAAPFMSACIIVTQLVIACSAVWVGRLAGGVGRKPLLLIGFGVLPVRGALYAMTHVTGALIAIQVLDGVANAIFGVVSVLLVADRMRGTGHFNLAQGALATCVGLGAALSTSYGGLLAHHFGFSASFLGLGLVAVLALGLLWWGVPETLEAKQAA
jgi:MFS family permease